MFTAPLFFPRALHWFWYFFSPDSRGGGKEMMVKSSCCLCTPHQPLRFTVAPASLPPFPLSPSCVQSPNKHTRMGITGALYLTLGQGMEGHDPPRYSFSSCRHWLLPWSQALAPHHPTEMLGSVHPSLAPGYWVWRVRDGGTHQPNLQSGELRRDLPFERTGGEERAKSLCMKVFSLQLDSNSTKSLLQPDPQGWMRHPECPRTLQWET